MRGQSKIWSGVKTKVQVVQIIVLEHARAQMLSEKELLQKLQPVSTTKIPPPIRLSACAALP